MTVVQIALIIYSSLSILMISILLLINWGKINKPNIKKFNIQCILLLLSPIILSIIILALFVDTFMRIKEWIKNKYNNYQNYIINKTSLRDVFNKLDTIDKFPDVHYNLKVTLRDALVGSDKLGEMKIGEFHKFDKPNIKGYGWKSHNLMCDLISIYKKEIIK